MTLPPDLVLHAQLCAGVIAACWLLSVVTREYSWVDRIWSIVPPVYVGVFAAQAGWSDMRLDVMTALTTAWGARLTFNFWRKGGYAPGGEDYRWAVLRARMSPALYQVFNVVFIAGYQNVLLLLIALPAWRARQHPTPMEPLDWALAALFLLLLAGETLADQQQWDFHAQKRDAAARGEATDPPFLTTGLWAWSRHPNFFCEQAQWWVLYAIGARAAGVWIDATLAGAVLLTLLFHGSTQFTEALTLAKYPGYAAHQRTVSRLLPWPPRRQRAP
jgi:steroid 5-alpha reductase family enzyme